MLDFKFGVSWNYKGKRGDFTLFHRPFLLGLRDWRPAFELIAEDVLERHVVRQFETEGAADTVGWQQLAPATVKKRGSAHPILRISGAMFESFTPGGADHVQEIQAMRMVWGSENPYALFHEFGTGGKVNFRRAGARKVLAKARKAQSELDRGPGVAFGMPARPMLVYSMAMANEVTSIMRGRLLQVARQAGYARFGRQIESPVEARKIGEILLGA